MVMYKPFLRARVNIHCTNCSVQHALILQEDYTHLLRVLSTRYFKSFKSKKQLKFTDDTKMEIRSIVSQVMNSTYYKDAESSIGLIQWTNMYLIHLNASLLIFIVACCFKLYQSSHCITLVLTGKKQRRDFDHFLNNSVVVLKLSMVYV